MTSEATPDMTTETTPDMTTEASPDTTAASPPDTLTEPSAELSTDAAPTAKTLTEPSAELSTDAAPIATTKTSPKLTPQELAEKFAAEERLLDAYRELKKVKEDELTEDEKATIKLAESCTEFMDLMKADINPEWSNLGESKKNYRYQSMAYNLNYTPVRVDMIIESPVEKSLVLPLVATLSEVGLYPTWLPNWNKPKFRVIRSETLKKTGRLSQVFTTRTEAPLATIEFYVNATVVDDTDSSKEFVVNLEALQPGDIDGLVPPKEDKINRVNLSGGMVFRECPTETAEKAKALRKKAKGAEDENIVLVTFTVVYSNKDKNLKQGFIIRQMSHFVLRVVIGTIWSRVLGVAEDIRDGKRPEFDKILEDRKDTYTWVRECIDKIVD